MSCFVQMSSDIGSYTKRLYFTQMGRSFPAGGLPGYYGGPAAAGGEMDV